MLFVDVDVSCCCCLFDILIGSLCLVCLFLLVLLARVSVVSYVSCLCLFGCFCFHVFVGFDVSCVVFCVFVCVMLSLICMFRAVVLFVLFRVFVYSYCSCCCFLLMCLAHVCVGFYVSCFRCFVKCSCFFDLCGPCVVGLSVVPDRVFVDLYV